MSLHVRDVPTLAKAIRREAQREAKVHVNPVLAKLPEKYRESVEKRDALQIALTVKHGMGRRLARAIAWWRWERGLSLVVRP